MSLWFGIHPFLKLKESSTNPFNGLSSSQLFLFPPPLTLAECILTTCWGNCMSSLKTEQGYEGRGEAKKCFFFTQLTRK